MWSKSEITRILVDWERDPQEALERLTPLIYSELRKLAASYLRRERADHTLQPTALDARSLGTACRAGRIELQGSSAFYRYRCPADAASAGGLRAQTRAEKRGGGAKVQLDLNMPLEAEGAGDFLDLNQALEKLKAWDERKCQVIELRFFGGMAREEIAEVLGLSLATVKRDLTLGEAFLRSEMA